MTDNVLLPVVRVISGARLGLMGIAMITAQSCVETPFRFARIFFCLFWSH